VFIVEPDDRGLVMILFSVSPFTNAFRFFRVSLSQRISGASVIRKKVAML
jgi:hypothetical protein